MLDKARIEFRRRAGLLAPMLLIALLHASVASAQEQPERSASSDGLWVGGSLAINRPWASKQLARGWERVGQLGFGAGAALSAGYDASRFGIGIELESINSHVGSRPGRSLAVAALLRIPSPWQPSQSWPARMTAGYVRYGLGGAFVLPSEIPAGFFHSEPSPFAEGERLVLLGNGFRMGIEAKHALSARTGIAVNVGGDLVRFGSATYQHADQALTNAGWGVIPRLAVGIAVGRGR